MSQPLTKGEFRRTMSKFMGLVATKDDMKVVITGVRDARQRLHQLVTSVDRFGKRQTDDHDELLVLRSRYERMADVLVKKGVASPEELAV